MARDRDGTGPATPVHRAPVDEVETVAAPAAPGRRARRAVPRWIVALVFACGFGHAALYAVAFPPWAIEDEQQHVDYVWKLAYDHRLPSIEDEIDFDIVEAVFGSDRFESYGMTRPNEPTADSMGLQARSYAAYHPPAVYVALTPLTWATGGRALLALYVLRLTSALAAGAVAALTALLAADLLRRARAGRANDVDETATRSIDRIVPLVALAAGLAMAALPALADSGGRVDTDIYATLVVVLGCRVLLRWVDEPSYATSWWVGAVLGVAVLTRETAVVLAIPVVVATAALLRGPLLDRGLLTRAFVPPAVASVAWIGFQYATTDHVDGSRAFLDTYGHLIMRGDPRPVAETIGDALLVPYGAWGVPWIVVIAVAAVAVAGLVLLARAGQRPVAAVAGGMLAFLVLAMVLVVVRGLNVPSARLLLPAYPAVVAAATVGWSTLRHRWAPFALTAAVVAFGVWFAAFELLARFSPRVG